MAKKNIITVDASHLAEPSEQSPPQYAVMMNPTRDEIVDYANEHQHVVVFPFFTGTDVAPVTPSSDGLVVQPFHLGNHPAPAHEHLIAAWVTSVFGRPLDQCERVL